MSEEHKNCKYRFKGKSCEDCPLNCKFKRLQEENEKLRQDWRLDCLKCEYKNTKADADKYKQVLKEIRNKLKKYDANVGDTIIANPIQDCYDTYKLIDEVLNDRD